MSSIIKALKKLEDDAPRPNESVYRNQNINIRRAVLERSTRRTIHRKWIAGSLLAGVVLVSGWFFLGRGGKNEEQISVSGSPGSVSFSQDIKDPIPTSGRQAVPSINKRQEYPVPQYWDSSVQTLGEEKKTSGIETFPKAPPERATAVEVPSNIMPSEPERAAAQDLDAPDPVIKRPDFSEEEVKETEEGVLITPSKKPEKSVTAVAERSLDQFNLGPPPDSKADLDLQALVWSDDPDNRFAVIDGRILKEDQVFDRGVRVLKINWDSIILEFEGRQWQLIQY